MNKIRCLLVDDEPPALDLLLKYVGMIDQLEVVGKSHNAVKAFDLLKNGNVDLIFLDIRMPVLNGIDFLKTLKHPPAVIFTTAYREYAVEGYDLDIVDYLLKPIAFDRFLKAVDRFRERSVQHDVLGVPEFDANPHIFLNVNRTHHKVYLNDIEYIESLKDYVRVHTNKENLVVKGNIGSFMKRIPDEKFVRIHRSYAVALDHIQSFNQSEIVVNDQNLPIGVSYKKVVMERMG